MIKDIIIRAKKGTAAVVLGEIGIGGDYSFYVNQNGIAWAWGDNVKGQLGDGTTVSKITPVSVAGAIKTFCKISAGGGSGLVTAGSDQRRKHTLAIDKNGRAWAWGDNAEGQLGDGTTVDKCTPVSVAGAIKTFCQISAGFVFSLAIDKNGRAWGWGRNTAGQIGDNSTTQRNTPVSVAGAIKTFCKISAGGLGRNLSGGGGG